ncbi:ribosome rescue GTPase HflX [Methylomagnum sp.]
MFERPKSGERAILVQSAESEDQASLQELRELSISAGAIPVAIVTGKRRSPDPRFYIGQGKLEELSNSVKEHQAELVLFDNSLSPSQERNIEKALNVRVVDRTGLILDIFAQRAQSFEGKLQVELAQLRHLSTRLIRGWTHLERQKGGIGLRGPGETQLETDKRLIAKRIAQIQKRLEKVDRQRNQSRVARRRAELPLIGLVGYTNAGKSTLFNALTGSTVYAADQLFATLDPTVRRLTLVPGLSVVLADTVGFIRHLPHELVAAFKSTLREAAEADLLLHVIDATDERMEETVAEVEAVLREIGAETVKCIQVFNKIDKLEGVEPRVEMDEQGLPSKLWLSAVSSIGLPLLLESLQTHFRGAMLRRTMHLSAEDAGLRSQLYSFGHIIKDDQDENGGWFMEVELPIWRAGLLGENLGVMDEKEAEYVP